MYTDKWEVEMLLYADSFCCCWHAQVEVIVHTDNLKYNYSSAGVHCKLCTCKFRCIWALENGHVHAYMLMHVVSQASIYRFECLCTLPTGDMDVQMLKHISRAYAVSQVEIWCSMTNGHWQVRMVCDESHIIISCSLRVERTRAINEVCLIVYGQL